MSPTSWLSGTRRKRTADPNYGKGPTFFHLVEPCFKRAVDLPNYFHAMIRQNKAGARTDLELRRGEIDIERNVFGKLEFA